VVLLGRVLQAGICPMSLAWQGHFMDFMRMLDTQAKNVIP
jgi:hypothetical protein